MNHWIALYLTGKYPGRYLVPDKLRFIDAAFEAFPSEFSDAKVRLIENLSEYEFYFTVLNKIERLSREKYNDFLIKLEVPSVLNNPVNVDEKIYDADVIAKFLLNANEYEFGKFIVTPLLIKQGFKDVFFKGRVSTKDYGLDYYPMAYNGTFGQTRIVGVQLKAVNMSNGDSNNVWTTLKSEMESAFTATHSYSGNKVKINEYIIINSRRISQEVIAEINEISAKYNFTVSMIDGEKIRDLLIMMPLPISLEKDINKVANRKPKKS